jgi:hypothetical protein
VWNKALSMPFRSAGLDGPQTVCPALLQVRQARAALKLLMRSIRQCVLHMRSCMLFPVCCCLRTTRYFGFVYGKSKRIMRCGFLQGMAESREMEDFDGCRFSYCLISRRCRLHVGPRYKARGLNEAADPGNEIECDQVVWKHSTAAGKPLAWSRCGD